MITTNHSPSTVFLKFLKGDFLVGLGCYSWYLSEVALPCWFGSCIFL
jgi:hypothetical protein